MNLPIIIASSKVNHLEMAERIQKITGHLCYFINSKDKLNYDFINEIKPKYIFFPHWSNIIPSEIYENFTCVIFHMTDLPYGRGGSPLQNLILQGNLDTKITAFRCIDKVDAGPIYLKSELSLDGSANEIFSRAYKIIENMILELMQKEVELVPEPQIGNPTLFKRRRPEEGNLVNAKTLNQVYDYIRMLDAEGYPNAFIYLNHFKFEFNNVSRQGSQVNANVSITYNSKVDSK